MILARADTNTFGFHNINSELLYIILQDLIRAFTYLSFTIKLKAAAKDVKLILERNRGVALATLYLL